MGKVASHVQQKHQVPVVTDTLASYFRRCIRQT